jgi:hypothetical protein
MTAVDTDIFVIAALHPEDPRSAVNGRFVELMLKHRGHLRRPSSTNWRWWAFVRLA